MALPPVDAVPDFLSEGYDSAFEPAPRRAKRGGSTPCEQSAAALTSTQGSGPRSLVPPPRASFLEEFDRSERLRYARNVLAGMTAWERHKRFINDFVLFYGDGDRYLRQRQQRTRNDYHVIAEEHRFLWDEQDTANMTWEKELAKKYHDKLFKAYCLCDLTNYQMGHVGMRWRTEREVFEGKGQFICGNVACSHQDELTSWEMQFAYKERDAQRKALVKVRLCPRCSKKLHHQRRKEKAALQDKKQPYKPKPQQPENRPEENQAEQNDTLDEDLINDLLI